MRPKFLIKMIKGLTANKTVSPQILHAVNKERKTAFNRKNVPIYELKFIFFHKWSKHVVKVEIWRFFEKIEKPWNPRVFVHRETF